MRPFAAALNALEPELLERLDVSFIGRTTPPWPVEAIKELLSEPTRRTLRSLTFETTLDQHEALDQLRRPGTLAVMPSYEENSPNTVYECLENGIPFIASNAAGIRELVAPDDRDRVLFEPTVEGIAEALRRTLLRTEMRRPGARRFRRCRLAAALGGRALAAGAAAAARGRHGRDRRPGMAAASGRCGCARAGARRHARPRAAGFGRGCRHLRALRRRGRPPLSRRAGRARAARERLRHRRSRSSLPAGSRTRPRRAGPCLRSSAPRGAKIVSVPIPLVSSAAPPASLDTHPAEALRVMKHFEEALPRASPLPRRARDAHGR